MDSVSTELSCVECLDTGLSGPWIEVSLPVNEPIRFRIGSLWGRRCFCSREEFAGVELQDSTSEMFEDY